MTDTELIDASQLFKTAFAELETIAVLAAAAGMTALGQARLGESLGVIRCALELRRTQIIGVQIPAKRRAA